MLSGVLTEMTECLAVPITTSAKKTEDAKTVCAKIAVKIDRK